MTSSCVWTMLPLSSRSRYSLRILICKPSLLSTLRFLYLSFFFFFFSSRKFRLVEISTSIDELHASTFLNFHLDSKWKSRTVHSRSKRLFAFKCIKTPDKYRARLDGKSGARRITRAKKRRNLCTVVCASLWIRLVEILKSDLSAKMDRTEFPPPSRLFGISETREFKDVVSMTRTFEVF